jgi:subtilisin
MTETFDDTRSASRGDRRKRASSDDKRPSPSSDEMRSASRSDRRKRASARHDHYMMAPVGPGLTLQILIDRLNAAGGVEIVRTHAGRGAMSPPIAVVRMSDESAAEWRRSAAGALVIESDRFLRAASIGLSPQTQAMAAITAFGPGFTTTIQALTERDLPVKRAEVRLLGEQWTAQGQTDENGKIDLTLYGETPETVGELFVKPRSGCWGLWRHRPELQTEAVNTFFLEPLSPPDEIDWGGKAMRFDRLSAECRGTGIKIALIDSGVATTHRQLAKIDHGIDVRGSDERAWSQDVIGHGTPCAGIIGATPDAAHGIRGYALESELHVCKLPPDACCSDLVAALDYCVQAGIDVACVGFGCQRGSAIVEQRIMAAKQQGVAIIAAAGNGAGAVQFPACSPHVMAVGAIGQLGSYPQDSPQAAHAATAELVSGGLFVPLFSCRGPEIDLCAPGVAVVSCQAPDGYAAWDGTSLAASHVAALAALILAHNSDFRRDFALRDFRRVERLFQILKDTAQPIGHPWQTGAGLPDAARALGLPSQHWPLEAPLDAGLEEMRNAVRHVERVHFGTAELVAFEPPRGPATVTRLPLSPLPLIAGTGGGANVHALKAAMNLAGLSSSR